MTTDSTTLRTDAIRPRRMNGKCKACGAKRSALLTAIEYVGSYSNIVGVTDTGARLAPGTYGSPQVACVVPCACGTRITLKPVLGRVVASIACDSRCEHATGHKCECACGGRNHGKAHG
jgi:hypothetical protein